METEITNKPIIPVNKTHFNEMRMYFIFLLVKKLVACTVIHYSHTRIG
jgi:hypothetical protein